MGKRCHHAGTVAAPSSAPFWKLHHVATIQAQLIEDIFYSSRLDRYANASEPGVDEPVPAVEQL